MKKYMLIVLIGVSLSSCAAASSGTSPTDKGSKIDLMDDVNFDAAHSNVVLLKAYEPAPLCDINNALYFGFIPKPKNTEVKLGALKNKVNIFHLFYRCKV